ncbi:MAG: hypothetical protein RR909_03065 [Bacilli bacterium]
MANFDQEVVRLGLQFSRGLADTLVTFISSYKDFVGTKGDRSVKAYQKQFQGQMFTKRDKFVAQSTKKTGEASFEEMKLCEKDLKTFDKLCRNYGVDYLYEKKPNIDIQEIISKNEKDRSPYENKIMKNWTEKDVNGKIIETPDDAKITFRIKDLSKMEFVVEDLLKQKQKLKERMDKAQAKQKQQQKQKKDKEKNKKKSQEH